MYAERGSLPASPHMKRRLRRGTASTVSDGDTPRRDALHDLIAEAEPSPATLSLHGSTHSVNSDTNITSVSDTWQSEPGPHISNRTMYGTKLKMVKPMEGSMTLLQVIRDELFSVLYWVGHN